MAKATRGHKASEEATKIEILSAALDLGGLGVVILDADSRILHKNRKAQRHLALRDGISAGRELLKAGDRDATSELHLRVRAAATQRKRSASAEAWVVERPSGHNPWNLRIHPLRVKNQRQNPVALLISDPDAEISVDSESLQRYFGLSPAESRIAARLAEGHELSEIAREGGVATNTVRSQLKKIFAKTGTNRQAALAALILRSPAPDEDTRD